MPGYSTYPAQSSGGGGGGITGPGSSVAGEIALFADTSGSVLSASSANLLSFKTSTGTTNWANYFSNGGSLLVPDGNSSHSGTGGFFGFYPGLRFADDGQSAGDGFTWLADGTGGKAWATINWVMNGQPVMFAYHYRDGFNSGQGTKEIVVTAPLRGDSAGTVNGQTITLGERGKAWNKVYGYRYSFGSIGGDVWGNDNSAGRVQYFAHENTGVGTGHFTNYSGEPVWNRWFVTLGGDASFNNTYDAFWVKTTASATYADTTTVWSLDAADSGGVGNKAGFHLIVRAGNGSSAVGYDTNGKNLTLAGGQKATGGTDGQINLQTAGTTRAQITSTGSVVHGSSALSTSATDGFTYIATCAGAPTGTPTAQNSTVPMVFDTTNNKFWIYTGGAWKGIVLS